MEIQFGKSTYLNTWHIKYMCKTNDVAITWKFLPYYWTTAHMKATTGGRIRLKKTIPLELWYHICRSSVQAAKKSYRIFVKLMWRQYDGFSWLRGPLDFTKNINLLSFVQRIILL